MLKASLNSAEVIDRRGANRFKKAFARSHATKGNNTARGRFAIAMCAERDSNSKNVAAIQAKTNVAEKSTTTVQRKLSSANSDGGNSFFFISAIFRPTPPHRNAVPIPPQSLGQVSQEQYHPRHSAA